jgi:hypothetical protein
MRGVMVWRQRRRSGADKREDGHRWVRRGPYEQEVGKAQSHDATKEERKVRRRCSLDGGDGGGTVMTNGGSGGIGMSLLVL